MPQQVGVHNPFGATESVQVDRDPDSCPICFHSISPLPVSVGYKQESHLDRIFRCPSQACGRVFIARYEWNGIRYKFYASVPREKGKASLPRLVTKQYDQFVEIYSQALHAESIGLEEICGAGFRRSLEFLIKTHVQAGKDELTKREICRMLLGPCIQKYVTNPLLKQVAERAVWLGNDETHFEKRWEDKDLQDLKRLIELTASWIETELQTAEIIKSMPDPKAAKVSASPAEIQVGETSVG